MNILLVVLAWGLGSCVTLGLLISGYLMWSYRALERKRAEARNTLPSAGEVWMMDGKPLYIKATAKHGVLLVVETEGDIHSWWELWADWQTRLRNRIVLRTGQTLNLSGG